MTNAVTLAENDEKSALLAVAPGRGIVDDGPAPKQRGGTRRTGRRSMQIGLILTGGSARADVELAVRAEAAGFAVTLHRDLAGRPRALVLR